jgi:hypothetical protein
LDSSSHDSNLKSGSKLDLPYWLVKSVYNEKFKFASIEIPKWYKNFYHEILKADANVVDLRKMGPYYYDFGRLLVNLADQDSSQNIAKILLWVNFNKLFYPPTKFLKILIGQVSHTLYMGIFCEINC